MAGLGPGITGSVNAGLKPTKKQPKFPGGLDQHFGLGPGITGSVNAGVRAPAPTAKPAPNLGGITGHVLAPRAPAAPSLKGITGSVNAGVVRSGAQRQQVSPMARLNQTLGAIRNEEGKLNQFLKGGVGEVARQERLGARMQSQRETQAKARAAGYKPGGVMGAISNLGTALGSKELAGARTIFGTSGIPGAIGNAIGRGEAEFINLPVQAVPATARTIGAGVEALKGHPAAFQQEGKEFGQNSVIGASGKALAEAIHGKPGGAVKTLEGIPKIAGEHPIGTAAEVIPVLGMLDKGAGAFARLGPEEKTAVENGGVAGGPSRPQRELVPEGAKESRAPYSKGYLAEKAQKWLENKSLPEPVRRSKLITHFNRLEGELRRVISGDRRDARQRGAERIKGMNPGESDLVSAFGKYLPDPKVKDPATGLPMWRTILSQRIERLSKQTPKPNEELSHIEARAAHRNFLQRILEDRNIADGGDNRAFKAALDMAREKNKNAPEMQQAGLHTAEEMRVAKMKDAFHELFADQQPRVETTVPEGESPFFLGNKNIPVDQVDQMLHDKGFTREQRFYTTDKPKPDEQMLRGGHRPGGEKVTKGILTGENFIRGQNNPTYEHAVNQAAFERLLINIQHGDFKKLQNYGYSKEQAARLLGEGLANKSRSANITPEARELIERHITELRHENGAKYWEERNGRGPTQRANITKDYLKRLYPERDFNTMQIARPYSTARYRKALADRMTGDLEDRLDPYQLGEEHEVAHSLAPQVEEDHQTGAGHVALVDSVISKKMAAYDKMVRSIELSTQIANFWRRNNIALSIRHIPGVGLQEMPIRMAASHIGALSFIRQHRLWGVLKEAAEKSNDPELKYQFKRLESYTRGTLVAYHEDLGRHVTMNQLHDTHPIIHSGLDRMIKATERPITGAPLKLVRGTFRVYKKVTDAALQFVRRTLEHPPQMAGVGKHFHDELKRLNGKGLKAFGKWSQIEKDVAAGMLRQDHIDQAEHVFREYWGEWNKADPTTRKFLVISPFFRWYVNSLRFLFYTMPFHHPAKTALLVAMEGATEEQRKAEGQGYQGGLPFGTNLNPGELEPSQQGSIPFGKFPGGEPARYGAEYYTPPGALSGGTETALNAVLPWATGIFNELQGYNALTHKPVEEVNPQTGSKEPVTGQNQLGTAAALALLESFLPPVRYAASAKKERPPEKQDPLTRLLMKGGLPPGVAYALRPLRTEGTYKTKEPKGGFGGFSGFGSSSGFSAPK